MQKEKLYIAYGSNMNLPQMKQRCPTAKPVGTTEIKDYELLFRGSKTGAYATIEPKEGSFVPAMIWSVGPKDEIELDRYEGYPRFYDKESVELEVDGESVSAFVYVMTEGHLLGIPSDFYLKTIEEGYQAAGFDTEILEKAVEYTKERMASEQVDDYEQENMYGIGWW
jgi:gamma-glutamylcyclotransferase (GGCT)/AIG2-like uncharacterized protein YtfP